MSATGASKGYEFSEKNNWRRQIWKWAAKRIDPSRAKVLIFSGASCLDIPAMRFYGFLPSNITSIEANAEAAKKARSTYPILVFRGTSREFLQYAPEEMTYDVIFLDYCGGMTWDRMADMEFAFKRLNNRGIIGANFLRGRDDFLDMHKGREALFDTHGKHRGKWAGAWLRSIVNNAYKKFLNEQRSHARTAWYYENKNYGGRTALDVLKDRDDVGSSASFAAHVIKLWEDNRERELTTKSGLVITQGVVSGAKARLLALSGKTDVELLSNDCVRLALRNKPEWGDCKAFSYSSGTVRMDSFMHVVNKHGFSFKPIHSDSTPIMTAWVKKHLEANGLAYVRKQRFAGDNSDLLNDIKRQVVRGLVEVPRALAAAKAVQTRAINSSR